MTVLDFNKTSHKALAANVAINEAIGAAMVARAERDPPREYLGASSIGDDCLRKIHWQWRRPKPVDSARTLRVFARGHYFEGEVAKQFVLGGFHLERGTDATGFIDADGRFRGHCDGIFRGGPAIEGVGYPCLWEAKALGEKSWKSIEKDGLKKVRPAYWFQCQLYMAYLGLTEHPAIFSMLNVENGELCNMLVPFNAADAQYAIDRAVMILRADAAGETLPRVADDPSSFSCKFCAYKAECWNGSGLQ